MVRTIFCVVLTALLAACGARQDESQAAPAANPQAPLPASTAAMPPAESGSSDITDTARQFWERFGAAVHGDDVAALLSMTQMPLEIRGQLDVQALRQADEREIRTRIPALLEEDSGLQENGQTMRALIEQTSAERFAKLIESGSSVRLGAFEFERTPRGWLWVRAYTEQ